MSCKKEKKCSTIKHLKVNKLCVKNGKFRELETGKLLINGADVECIIKRPGVIINNNTYDCMDEEGNPIKPDNIDQDVWDVLTCNRNAEQLQLENDFLLGREEIRCIKKAYGCEPSCPPDCPISDEPGCTGTCPSFFDEGGETGCNGVPVPPECIPDENTCDLFIKNYLYKTLTIPFVNINENECGGINNEGFPYANSRFITNIGYDLDIVNETCTLGTRVATAMIHFAYKGPAQSGSTGTVCPGETGMTGINCILNDTGVTGCSDLSTEVNCGIISISCQQYYFTININLGENFSKTVNIPSDIIQAMINATPLPLDPTNIIGAFQLCIFIEDGLRVSTNQTLRGGGGGSSGNPTTQTTGCFNGEAKIVMANGEYKSAKDVFPGDEIKSINGETTKVVAKYVQKEGNKQLVQINDLIISQPHRIMYKNKWIKPIKYPGAKLIESEIQVFNFITENRKPFIVEDIIVSSVGEFCEGSHDLSNPIHQLWTSDDIVEIFKTHPQWPVIELENNDNFLNMIKDIDFAKEYLKNKLVEATY